MIKYVQYLGVSAVMLLTSVFGSCRKTDVNRTLARSIFLQDSSASLPVLPDEEAEKNRLLLDTALFDKLQLHLAHGKPDTQWPVKTEYPLPGAILPFKRIVAY